MPTAQKALYSEKDSPFFKLSTKKKLAKLLFSSVGKLTALSKAEGLYHSFLKPKKKGGFRSISAPRRDLKELQGRIAELLQRIAPPDFLFAPVGGRSYVDNAARHLGAQSFRLLDIEDFFPSCTADRVIWYFHTRLGCPVDVAAIIRGIVTENGCLPQGSPCSPILAYLTYVDMWEQIDELVTRHNCKLSVYADDISISGRFVPETMIWKVKQILHKYGHRHCKSKERSIIHRSAEITGAIVRGNQLVLPNRQHKKIFELKQKLKGRLPANEREDIMRQLRGRKAQLGQVLRRPKPIH